MSIILRSIVCDDESISKKIELSYYIDFYIKSSYVSIDNLRRDLDTDLFGFDNKAQFYHYYLDHLLYSMGQISIRLKDINNIDVFNDLMVSEEDYPILINKQYRNTIEHINEYNLYAIDHYGAAGGFNYIDKDVDQSLVESIMKNKQTYTYTFDRINMRVLIYRNNNELSFDIDNLIIELNHLEDVITRYYNSLTVL